MAKLIYTRIYPLDNDLNKTWFVQYKLEGGKPQKKYGDLAKLRTVEERKKEAARIIIEIQESHSEGNEKKKDHDALVRIMQDNFKTRCIYLRPKSVSTYHTKLLAFIKWYRLNKNSRDVQETGIGHSFVKYLKELNLSHTTINAYRNTIKEFWPKNQENPFKETFKLPEARSSYRYFNEAQQGQLKLIMSLQYPQLWLAIQLQYYLLLRPNELRTIKVGSFNFHESTVTVHGSDSKNKKTQHIAIPDELLPDLKFLQDLPPYFYVLGSRGKPGLAACDKKHFPTIHQRILKKLKYNTQVYKFYSWKHTGAVMWFLKTGDIKSLQLQGRWHSMDMVNEYLKNLGVMDIDRVKTDFPKIGGSGAAVIKIAN